MSITTIVAGETVELFATKAMYWPRRQTLFIADPHWGKATAFRTAGVAISPDPIENDLARLSELLRSTGAARLVILGDLLHAKKSKSKYILATISDWRGKLSDLEIITIRGNHDRSAGDPPSEWRFDCRSEPALEVPFALRHFPIETPNYYTLAGHLHPAVTLVGKARQRLRLPCFCFGPRCGLFPAFGSFTGTSIIAPSQGSRVFAIAGDEVIEV